MTVRRFELHLGQADYPSQLASCPDPPAILYGVGDPSALVPGLAVIGARRATPYGLAAAGLFSGWAASAGYVIVSGGAIGCDQAAHRAALAANGKTVAVMAGGADVPYPRAAGDLLKELSSTGAVVSEHPWGTEPKRWTFRTRNRIIAGLSEVLLVVEASLPSGTFSTADYALDAQRTICAVPGSIFSPESRGPNRLLAQGAQSISDTSELRTLLEASIGPVATVQSTDDPSMGGSEDPILRAIRANAMKPDDIAFALGMDVVAVARRIGALEVAGLVSRYRDGRYGCEKAVEIKTTTERAKKHIP